MEKSKNFYLSLTDATKYLVNNFLKGADIGGFLFINVLHLQRGYTNVCYSVMQELMLAGYSHDDINTFLIEELAPAYIEMLAILSAPTNHKEM